MEGKVPKAIGSEKISVKEQMEMLQNLKELLDAGVVTPRGIPAEKSGKFWVPDAAAPKKAVNQNG